jgi:hypothetical protein
MLILVVLEPAMFLAKRRDPRSYRAKPGQAQIMEDSRVFME